VKGVIIATATHHVLIAIGDSESSWKIIAYAAGILDKQSRITLYYVFYRLPYKDFKDDAILSHDPMFEKNGESLKTRLLQKHESLDILMSKAKNPLVEDGFDPQNVQVKIQEKKADVADNILEELTEEKYDTVVVGRREKSVAMDFLLGRVPYKIVQHARNCAVWVVE